MSSGTLTRPTIPETLERSAAEPPSTAADVALVRDPICGMMFAPDEAAATRVADGVTYHFCAERCARMFDRHRQQRDALAGQEPIPAPPVAAPTRGSAGSVIPRWLVPALGIAAAAAVLAVTVLGVPTSTLFTGALILACPLMHVFMMRGHGGHGGQGDGDRAAHSDAQKPAGGRRPAELPLIRLAAPGAALARRSHTPSHAKRRN